MPTKIAVWVEPDMVPTMGGGFSIYSELIRIIDAMQFNASLEVVFFSPKNGLKPKLVSQKQYISYQNEYKGLYSILEALSKLIPIFGAGIRQKLKRFYKRKLERNLKNLLLESGVKIVFYPFQMPPTVLDFPFIVLNWDVGHRSSFGLKEFIEGRTFAKRETYYNEVLPRAMVIICESEAGKEEVVEYCRVNPARIHIMPLFSRNFSTIETGLISKDWGLEKGKFFFYPAQFWAHKNHVQLLEAFEQFNSRKSGFKLVLCGSERETKRHIERSVNEKGLKEQVVLTGFIDDSVLKALYLQSACLIMPTLLGPTNVPLLEAASLGIPVLCSDFKGHREMMGENAIYFDPLDVDSIIQAMSMVTDEGNREEIALKTKQFKSLQVLNPEYSVRILDTILLQAAKVRRTWN